MGGTLLAAIIRVSGLLPCFSVSLFVLVALFGHSKGRERVGHFL